MGCLPWGQCKSEREREAEELNLNLKWDCQEAKVKKSYTRMKNKIATQQQTTNCKISTSFRHNFCIRIKQKALTNLARKLGGNISDERRGQLDAKNRDCVGSLEEKQSSWFSHFQSKPSPLYSVLTKFTTSASESGHVPRRWKDVAPFS